MKSVGMVWKVATSMEIVVDGSGQMACHHWAIAACVVCF